MIKYLAILSLTGVVSFANAQTRMAMEEAAQERNAHNDRIERENKEKLKETKISSGSNYDNSNNVISSNWIPGVNDPETSYLSYEGQIGKFEKGWHKFNEGWCLIGENGGFLLPKGTINTPVYATIKKYNGLAIASVYDLHANEKYGILDASGETIVPFVYNGIAPSAGDGLFLISKKTTPNLYYPKRDDVRYGIIGPEGNIISEPAFEEITSPNSNLFISSDGDHYGIINKQGIEIISPTYRSIDTTFSCSGFFLVLNSASDQGLISSTTGKEIVPPKYYLIECSKFKGLFKIIKKSENLDLLYGLISETGKIITEPVFKSESEANDYAKTHGIALIPRN